MRLCRMPPHRLVAAMAVVTLGAPASASPESAPVPSSSRVAELNGAVVTTTTTMSVGGVTSPWLNGRSPTDARVAPAATTLTTNGSVAVVGR